VGMFPWMKIRKKTEPELPYEPPIHLGNKSNGEFFHEQTPLERKMRAEILRRGEENARHLGMERREFMASTMGMATSLAVLNMASGCGDDAGHTDGNGNDGGYLVPKDAEVDCSLSNELVSGDEFIMDLQTHEIEDKENWLEDHPGGMYGGPGFASFIVFYDCEFGKDPACIGETAYVENIFLNADTTVAVLSGFPSNICDDAELCNALVSNQFMVEQRNKINDAAGSQRMVQHVQVAPNDNWPKQAEMMRRIREDHGNHGWKCYPPWGPNGGWRMDDPEVAYPFYDLARELGNPLICAHKGFPLQGFNRANSDPADVGPAAVANPDITFVIYHSAFETGQGTGAYDPDTATPLGVDRLVRTIKEHDLKGKNVYAELGSAWALSQTPNMAMHLIGKLVEALGEDNVVFGSECLWMGSPQPQIERLRTLTISEEFQTMYGYPEMTDSLRRKIMGLNAAKIYGIDPTATRCKLDTGKLAQLKRTMDGELGKRRWAFMPQQGPSTRREFMNLQRLRHPVERDFGSRRGPFGRT
jgi:predicted TIM-barrel fold metal-dependent hydrolase